MFKQDGYENSRNSTQSSCLNLSIRKHSKFSGSKISLIGIPVYITFLFVALDGEDKTLKNPSNRPCVLPVRALVSFFMPFLILSSLK